MDDGIRHKEEGFLVPAVGPGVRIYVYNGIARCFLHEIFPVGTRTRHACIAAIARGGGSDGSDGLLQIGNVQASGE